MVYGPGARIRDVDIVVAGATVADIATVFRDSVRRRTRFGGVSLNVQGWRFDIWPLEQTWAFREGILPRSDISELPKSTFLNVEAVAVDLEHEGTRNVYEHGFFQGITKRVVEINLEDNPHPDLCIVRSLFIAARLGFSIGPRLVRYVAKHSSVYTMAELLQVQRSHYGGVKHGPDELQLWLAGIRRHASKSGDETFSLRAPAWEQLDFWSGTNWEFLTDLNGQGQRHALGTTVAPAGGLDQ